MSERYCLEGAQIEERVRKDYEKAINQVKGSDLVTALNGIGVALEALSRSKPEDGREVDWAAEMILAYRNLTRLYEDEILKNYLDKKRTEEKRGDRKGEEIEKQLERFNFLLGF